MSSTGLLRLRRAIGSGVSAIAIVGAALPGLALAQDAGTAGQPGTVLPGVSATGTEDAIIVTGRRAALEAAEERKRRSETIIDSVVADDAGKLPDASITEVLQRVSGVTIVRFSALNDPDHFSVQGSGVQVRGLTGVASRLNGREIFSANNGRALLWGDVTPELMAAVDVYKASTADLIEGGTGGQIDLRTRVPFDYKDTDWHVAVSAEASAGDLVEEFDHAVSVLVSKNWETGIGDIGLTVDLADSQFSSLSQFFRVNPYLPTEIDGETYYVPGGFLYGDEEFERDRRGIYGALQWAPTPELTLTATYFESRYENNSSDYGAFVTSNQLAVDPATSRFDDSNGLISSPAVFVRDTATFAPSPSAIVSGGNKGVWQGDSVTRDYSFAFDYTPDDGGLSLSGAVQRVDGRSTLDRLDVFRDLNFSNTFGLDLSGDLPLVTVPEGSQAIFDNPANYFWAASMPHNEDNRGQLTSANLDAEYEFEPGFFRSVKAGARWSERTERDLSNGYNWAALGRSWNGDPQLTFANAAPGDIERHTFDEFFRGDANLPGELFYPSFDLVSRLDRGELTQSPPAGFCAGIEGDCSAAGPLPNTGYGGQSGIRQLGYILPDDRTDYSTKTVAGYALVRFGDPENGISGNVGARVVHLENESSGYFQQNVVTFIRNGETVTLAAVAEVREDGDSFTRVLPSINVDYTLASDIKLRAAYNITMDLPTFNALRASGSLGVATVANQEQGQPGLFTNFTTTTGNPLLKPTMANNFDLSIEYYPRAGTSFHFAPFYKRLTDLPIYALTEQPVTVVFEGGATEQVTAASTDYSNAEEAATVLGFELGGRIFLDMLPGWLSGIGVEANYTFIDSKNPGDVYRDINGIQRDDAPLVGLSRHNANATLLYELDPFSFRLAYSWRSRYLQSTNSNGTNFAYDYFTAPGVSQSVQLALPVYGDAFGTLDAGLRYKITEQLSVSVQATNILASTQRTLMGGHADNRIYTRSWFQSDRRLALGVNFSF